MHDDPAGQEHGLGHRVGHEQRGERTAGEQRHQLVVQPLAGQLVQRPERLVEQEQLRLEHQRAGQRRPHPHAARQRRGPRAVEPGQAHQVQHPLHPAPPLRAGDALQLGEQLDVARHRPPRQQRRVLEDVAEPAGRDVHRPRRRGLESRHQPQQRALAASRRAHDAHELAAPHPQVQVPDGGGAVGERPAHPGEFEHRIGGRGHGHTLAGGWRHRGGPRCHPIVE